MRSIEATAAVDRAKRAQLIELALNCKIGGYPCIRHNQVRDLLASLMKEVCTDVRTESELQPLTGEVFNRATTITTDEARLDIEARGFWECRQECTMFDVRVFNPCADSYRHAPLSTLYRRQEQLKRNAYKERVRQVEKHPLFRWYSLRLEAQAPLQPSYSKGWQLDWLKLET